MIPFMDLIVEGVIFFLVIAVALALFREMERVLDQRRRLADPGMAGASSAAPLLLGRAIDNRLFQWVQSSTSLNDSEEHNKLRRDLLLAGFESPAAPVWFVIVRFTLAILLPILFLAAQSVVSKPVSGVPLIFGTLMFCGIGLLSPSSIVTRIAGARRRQIEREFPDALDLMVICVESGLSLDATFVRVGQEVAESHPRIAREFNRLSDALRAGRGRADALRAMAEMTDVSGIKSFVALVIQTDILGASIAQTLRTYAGEMRETRYLRAEERAMKIPVLMTIPLVACILPVIITALLLPVIIDVVRHLLPALTSHAGAL